MIRCSSKVIIVEDGKILLNRCRREDGRVYYDLPGGGQHSYETMEQAAIREVKEETGFHFSHIRLAAIGEEISTDPVLRERFPDYTHRIFHIFAGELDDKVRDAPTKTELSMECCEWVALDALHDLPELYPKGLIDHLPDILSGKTVVFLDTFYNDESGNR